MQILGYWGSNHLFNKVSHPQLFSLFALFFYFVEKAKQKLKKWHDKYSRTSRTSAPQGKTFNTLKPPPAVILVISCRPDTGKTIKRDLEGILLKQLVEREVDFSRLDAMELEAVQVKVNVLEMSVECRRPQGSGGVNGNRAGNSATAEARDLSASGGEAYVLKGLKEDVLSVTDFINRAIQKALCKDLQDKEEATLALTVQWSIQNVNGDWHEVSLHDNYMLEEAHMKNEVFVDMTAPDGMMVKINLKKQEATNCITGITYKVKRSESDTCMSQLVVFPFLL